MSTPANLLSNYTTYSYHHILIACANNDVSVALEEVTDITQFDHNGPGGKYSPVQVGELGGYVVIINSTQDAEFYIDSVTWGSVYTPTGTTDTTTDVNSTELDGELNIVEPNGMRFINVLAEAGSDLGVSVNSIALLLKTIFIGQNPDGTIDTISGIRPLVSTIVDMKANFDYTGAQYKMSIVGGRDGSSKHPGISHIVGGSTLKIDKNASITKALQGLQDKANAIYQVRKDKILEQQERARVVALSHNSTKETFIPGIDFLPVRYELIIDPAFDNYIAATNDVESTGGADGGHTVSFQPDLSIHAAIGRIMETSKGMLAATSTGIEKDGKNRKFTYNITDVSHTTKDEQIVYIHIIHQELTTTLQDPDVQLGTDASPPNNHVIEFDYVYTGKNVDILDFGMKLDLALAYFQTLQSARPLDAGQAENTTGTRTDEIPGNTDQVQAVGSNTGFGQTQKGPLFVGPQILNNSTKKANVIETSNARNVLASFAQASTIGVTLKIAGNPSLLEQILPNINGGQDNIDRITDSRTPPTEQITTDWSRIPGYCKINIMMPARPGSGLQYESFWYEGYYRIQSIEHSFKGGEFTQELTLFSMPVTTNLKDNTATSGLPPSPKQTRTPPSAIPATPTTKAAPGVAPSVLISQYDDLIVEKANKYSIDPNLLRALVKTESNFNTNAVSPGVGAAGLGQLMPATARWLADDKLHTPFIMNSVQDDRFDPERNLELASFYISDLLRRVHNDPRLDHSLYTDTDLALASYNAGLGRVRQYGGVPPITFSRGETYNYVNKINGLLSLVGPPEALPLPEVPDGPDVAKMTPTEMVTKFIVGGFF